MAQDATGYIWIGTFEGLARFDGDTFLRLLPVAPPEIRRGTDDLIIEPDGTLWIGTKTAGLYRVDTNGDITRYTVADGLASDVIVSLYRDPLDRNIQIETHLPEIVNWVTYPGALSQIVSQLFSDDNAHSGLEFTLGSILTCFLEGLILCSLIHSQRE